MTFIDSVLEHVKDSESPLKYHYWSALVAIAAVVKKNVYLDKFRYKLYPNIYVLLVGRSGLRKGPPVNLAKALVTAIDNTRVFSGRLTIEGLISSLAQTQTKPGNPIPDKDANAVLFASEFASFIVQNPAALTILTDIYDTQYNTEWSYTLRNSPVEKLHNPCLNLFGASNEVHIKDSLPDNAVGGGFLARTFIIFADKKSRVNPLTTRPEEPLPFSDLVQQLRDISRVRGQFDISPGGRELYEAWYHEFSRLESSSDDTTGTLERIHDHILKTAMLISLSRKTDLRIEIPDIEEAIKACQDFIPGAKRISMGQSGKSVSAPGTATLLKELIINPLHKISRTEALQKHWAHFDAFELDRIAESLFAQKAIGIGLETGPDGKRDTFYTATEMILSKYRRKEEK